MAEKTVGIKGMTCGHCEGRVSKEIMAIPGVIRVVASAENGNVVVSADSEIPQESIERAVHAAGYSILP